MIHTKAVSIIQPKEGNTVCPVHMMKINSTRPVVCFFVPCGCCPMIGGPVYPCEKEM